MRRHTWCHSEVPASNAENFGSFADTLWLLRGDGGGGAGGRRRDGGKRLDLETEKKSETSVWNILSAAPEEQEEEIKEEGIEESVWTFRQKNVMLMRKILGYKRHLRKEEGGEGGGSGRRRWWRRRRRWWKRWRSRWRPFSWFSCRRTWLCPASWSDSGERWAAADLHKSTQSQHDTTRHNKTTTQALPSGSVVALTGHFVSSVDKQNHDSDQRDGHCSADQNPCQLTHTQTHNFRHSRCNKIND